jgi:hypothetical protein
MTFCRFLTLARSPACVAGGGKITNWDNGYGDDEHHAERGPDLDDELGGIGRPERVLSPCEDERRTVFEFHGIGQAEEPTLSNEEFQRMVRLRGVGPR